MKPTKFQIDCLRFVLGNYPEYAFLIQQLDFLQLNTVENTGTGCFYHYDLDGFLPAQGGSYILDDGFEVQAKEFSYGATLKVWVENGAIEALDVLGYDSESYPVADPDQYEFRVVPVNIIDLTKDKS